jgi:hypothetical protein
MDKKEMPEFCTIEMLEYLDDVRESGVINMYGAAIYVTMEFPELSKKQCNDVLLHWMETFEDRHS